MCIVRWQLVNQKIGDYKCLGLVFHWVSLRSSQVNYKISLRALRLDPSRFPQTKKWRALKDQPYGVGITATCWCRVDAPRQPCPTKRLTPMGLFADDNARELGDGRQNFPFSRCWTMQNGLFVDGAAWGVRDFRRLYLILIRAMFQMC